MRPHLLFALTLVGCTEYGTFIDTRLELVDEIFTVEGVKTDILFFADTSGSMTGELRDIGDNIGRFTSRLDESQADWRIIAVTGPDGCAQGGVLASHVESWQQRFATGIRTAPGQDEVDEWGLFNAFKALLAAGPGGCNEGFLRPDASLHVIFVSDEPDHSPGWQAGGDYWRDYVDPILYMKDERSHVRFSGITGPVPNGCDGAEPGTGYADAVAYTGGEALSICDEWTNDVELLAEASVLQDFFPLRWEPTEPDAIVVFVNSEERLEGWFYDAEAQGIRFTEGVPGAWDEVHARYSALVEYETERPVE